MPSSYPTSLDTLATNKQDDTDTQTGVDAGVSTSVGDHATHHNLLADAINKIEAELGVNPSGSSATVAAAIAHRTINVLDYGAVGDRTTDDTAAVVAAIAAADALARNGSGTEGSAVFFPSGRYKITAELVVPGGVSLIGETSAASSLNWPTDIGAGYGIKFTSNDPRDTAIRDLGLYGPGFFIAYSTIGGHPSTMHGVDLRAGGQIERCRIQGFNYGVRIQNNHEEIRYCLFGGCYYSVYFDTNLNGGGQVFEHCQFSGAMYAHFGVHPANEIGGVPFTRCHLSEAPYHFYGEAGTGGAQFVVGCVFTSCDFEGYGNGVFYDAKRTRNIDATFISCGEGSGFATAPIVGNPERAVIDAYSVTIRVSGHGGFPIAVGSESVIYCESSFGCDWEDATTAINNAVAAGKPLVVAQQPAGAKPSSARGRYDGAEWQMFHSSDVLSRGTVARRELVELLWDYQAVRTGTGLLVGVALTDGAAAASHYLVPAAVAGHVSLKTSDATIVQNDYVKLDTVNRGEVVKSTGLADGAIGYTTAAPSGGFVATRIRLPF